MSEFDLTGIWKDPDGADSDAPWFIDYPIGFGAQLFAEFQTFEQARLAVISAINYWCPTCRKGAVSDTEWGWECMACGQYDVAVGCVKP